MDRKVELKVKNHLKEENRAIIMMMKITIKIMVEVALEEAEQVLALVTGLNKTLNNNRIKNNHREINNHYLKNKLAVFVVDMIKTLMKNLLISIIGKNVLC